MVFRAVVFTFIPTAVELVLVCGLLSRTFTPIVSGLVLGTFVAYTLWTAALTRAAAEVGMPNIHCASPKCGPPPVWRTSSRQPAKPRVGCGLLEGRGLHMVRAETLLTSLRLQARKKVNKLDNLTTGKAVDALLNYETVKLFNNEQFEVPHTRQLQSSHKPTLSSPIAINWSVTGQMHDQPTAGAKRDHRDQSKHRGKAVL